MEDSTTYQYQQLADILQTELNSLLDNHFLNFAFNARVQKFAEGSVVVSFKIDAVSKTDGSDVISGDNILNAIMDNLNNELGYLFGKFLVPPSSVIISGDIINRDGQDEEEINDLEHQLETYEEEIFSKPRLESIPNLMFDGQYENDEVSTTTEEGTGKATATELNDLNLIEFVTTAKLAETDTQTELVSAVGNVEIITTLLGSRITDESADKENIDNGIESRTDIYDLSEISDETQTEYYAPETERTIENIELVYFEASGDELDNEEANNSEYDATTDNISLELNTFRNNIENF